MKQTLWWRRNRDINDAHFFAEIILQFAFSIKLLIFLSWPCASQSVKAGQHVDPNPCNQVSQILKGTETSIGSHVFIQQLLLVFVLVS